MKEIWKEVLGYEGIYEVSNLGFINSLFKGKRRIKCFTDNNGYSYVNLYKDKKGKKISVHYIVAANFLGFTKQENKAIDHINNIKTDNNLNNLQIISIRLNTSKDRVSNSGETGVCYSAKRKSYRASIRIKGKLISLGSSKNILKPKALYSLALENLNIYNGSSEDFRKEIKNLYNG